MRPITIRATRMWIPRAVGVRRSYASALAACKVRNIRAFVRSAARAAIRGQELRGCFLIFAIMDDRKIKCPESQGGALGAGVEPNLGRDSTPAVHSGR